MDNSNENQNDFLQVYLELVEAFLPKALADENSPEKIASSMEYSLMAGGKRIRPILTLAVADMLHEGASQFEEVENYAAAIEMIHTYSLIHDDLPAMDNDDMRRGKPSNHIAYGEDIAILAGDALLTKAFYLQYAAEKRADAISADALLDAWHALARYAGESGMIGGQIMDMEAEGETIDLAYLEKLQSLKTSCLIQAAIVGGAKLLLASDDVLSLLDDFGLYLGRAFQIQDDILDVEADPEVLGKSVGKDADNEKATYVTLLGLEGAKEKLKEVDEKCITILDALEQKSYNVEFLRNLQALLSGRKF